MTPPNHTNSAIRPSSPASLSVLIPAHNEALALGPLLDSLLHTLNHWPNGPLWEVIVVDDGSIDQTASVVHSRQSAHHQLHLIRLPAQKGQSTALAVGLQHATGQWVATLDADGQNDPADIPALWLEAHVSGCDAVLGWRQNRQDTRRTRWVSRIANRVRNAMLGQAIIDTGCSTRLLRSAILQTLPRFEGWHRFLGPMMAARGAVIAQIPVRHHPRVHGRSHYHWRNRGLRVILDLLGVAWLNRRIIHVQTAPMPQLSDSWRLHAGQQALAPNKPPLTTAQSTAQFTHSHRSIHP